jgi:hypothetical protein
MTFHLCVARVYKKITSQSVLSFPRIILTSDVIMHSSEYRHYHYDAQMGRNNNNNSYDKLGLNI